MKHLDSQHVSASDCDVVFAALDEDGSGEITYSARSRCTYDLGEFC